MPAPSVTTTVTDNSLKQNSAQTVSYIGLIGPASKGPFNTPVITSDFVSAWGPPIDNTYLADTVASILNVSPNVGVTVVRIGSQYQSLDGVSVTGGVSGSNIVNVTSTSGLAVGNYVAIKAASLPSTVNASITALSGQTLTLNKTLSATYTTASLSYSKVANSANQAETLIKSPVYGLPARTGRANATVTVTGDLGGYSIQSSALPAGLVVDSLVKIEQTGKSATREIKVSEIIPNPDGTSYTINFYPNNITSVGYQALSLQDTYTSATISIATGSYTNTVQAVAIDAGTWANTIGSNGLSLKVSPGTAPDTKNLSVYLNSTLVEVLSSLPNDPTAFVTQVNNASNYIKVLSSTATEPIGNTYSPWDTSYPTINICQFTNGYNGENLRTKDYLGGIDPVTMLPSGIEVFKSINTPATNVFILAAPDSVSLDSLSSSSESQAAVSNAIIAVGISIGASGVGSVPDKTPLNLANNYLATVGGNLNSYSFSIFWNWYKINSTINGNSYFVPPAVGYLVAISKLFDKGTPWIPAAGDSKGVIDNAVTLRYPYIPKAYLNATYGTDGAGNANVINPLKVSNSNIEVYGNLTTQRNSSKLSSIHSVVILNYTLKNIVNICKPYNFALLNLSLINSLTASIKNSLKTLQTAGAIQSYDATVTSGPSGSKSVIVNYSFAPYDSAEYFYVNANVNNTEIISSTITS